jgi:hypothetical protein
VGIFPGGNLEQQILDVLNRSVVAKLARQGGRRIHGTVDGATGGTLAGSGWSCTRVGLGTYTVTFTTSFSGTPTVLAGPSQSPVGVSAYDVEVTSPSATGFGVTVREPGVAFIDCTFGFIAEGPS